jgi:hypothetical protein
VIKCKYNVYFQLKSPYHCNTILKDMHRQKENVKNQQYTKQIQLYNNIKTKYNCSFFGPHFTCEISYYYIYFRLCAPYSCIFTSLSISIFILIDLSLNYIYKSYRNTKLYMIAWYFE